MKANELRIGNLIDLGNRIAKINEIYHTACTVLDLEETQDTIEDYERTKPIPLTRESLLKFGFQDKFSEKRIYFRIKGMLIEVKNGSKFYYNNIHLKYIHQLQNLYFALTGKELILKEYE